MSKGNMVIDLPACSSQPASAHHYKESFGLHVRGCASVYAVPSNA